VREGSPPTARKETESVATPQPYDIEPGDPAPATGICEAHNALGSRTGESVTVCQGEPLPRLPRAFTWRLAPVTTP
jgi:hypothetical protein